MKRRAAHYSIQIDFDSEFIGLVYSKEMKGWVEASATDRWSTEARVRKRRQVVAHLDKFPRIGFIVTRWAGNRVKLKSGQYGQHFKTWVYDAKKD